MVVVVTFGMTFTSVFSVLIYCCGVPPGAANSASDVAMVLSSFCLDLFGRFRTASLSSLCTSSACCSGENVGKCSFVEKGQRIQMFDTIWFWAHKKGNSDNGQMKGRITMHPVPLVPRMFLPLRPHRSLLVFLVAPSCGRSSRTCVHSAV